MSALLMAAGSVLGGLFNANASSNAADAQAEAASKAADVQWDMYSQSRDDAMPFMDMGYAAIPAYMESLGFTRSDPGAAVQYVPGTAGTSNGGPSNIFDAARMGQNWQGAGFSGQDPNTLNNRNGGSDGYWTVGDNSFGSREEAEKYRAGQGWQYGGFQETPGYQYNMEQMQRQTDRQQSAGGRSLSGSGLKELQYNAKGLANQEYNNQLNRLGGLVGQGQQQTNSMASLGQNYANQAGNAYMNAGNAAASGYEGQANAFGGTLNNLASIYTMNQMGAF